MLNTINGTYEPTAQCPTRCSLIPPALPRSRMRPTPSPRTTSFSRMMPCGSITHFRAGQFNMIYLPNIGEVPISLSSDPDQGEVMGHTIRYAGNVTRAISRLDTGDIVGVRGPYGTAWPLATLPRSRYLYRHRRHWPCAPAPGHLSHHQQPWRLRTRASAVWRSHTHRHALHRPV